MQVHTIEKKNENIVVVENNKMIAKLIEKLLGKLYNVHTYDTAEKAIYQLERDLKPFSVVSSYVLPNMNGDKFLHRVEKINPDIVRILLTSVESASEIVKILRTANANLYIKKPFENLNLLQILRTASMIFELRKENNFLNRIKNNFNEQYNALLDTVNKQNQQTEQEFKSNIRSVSSLITKAERFHFRPHTANVSSIAKELAKKIDLNDQQITDIVYASLITNHYKVGLPDRFKLFDPRFVKNDKEKFVIENAFKESLNNLINLPSIKKHAEIAGKVFENMDGSGFPFGLTGIDIPKESQVISIVNFYYHHVYCLKEEDIEILKINGRVVQSREETVKRHKDTITEMYKHIKWYDHDLFYKFQEMLKKIESEDLKFNQKDISISYDPQDYGTPKLKEGEERKLIEKKILCEQAIIENLDENGNVEDRYLQKQILVEDIKEGDILSKPIKNYSGVVVFKKNTKVTIENLKNLQKYLNNETIPSKAYIRIELNEDKKEE